jgi:hypothetical protein
LSAEVQQKWTLIKKVCRQKSAQVAALLNSVEPMQVEPGNPPLLVIQAKAAFHQEKLREPAKRETVEWALEQVLETPMRVRLSLAGETRGAAKAATGSTAAIANSAAPPIAQNGHKPAPTPPAPSSAQRNGHAASADGEPKTTPPAAAASQQELEDEVRADPVVREILKTGAVELAEVRPLAEDEA